jgi:sugar phosphate isomerase/epimerase
LLETIPKARAWGYDGIEIEAKRPHGSPLDLDAGARCRIRDAAGESGLEISCVASYNDFSSPIEEHRENELLMVREQIKLAADLGAPIVRVFAAWSGVTRRDNCITYDVARYNIDHRYPGTTALERWCYARECLAEAAQMAADAGVILALQNHKPVIATYQDMLALIAEVDSPALKACLDAPLFDVHSEETYREALEATGALMVHTHFGGRFERLADGRIVPLEPKPRPATGATDYPIFMRLAHEIVHFQGHTAYELCSPVLIGHRHAGLEYALQQAALAAEYMQGIIETVITPGVEAGG